MEKTILAISFDKYKKNLSAKLSLACIYGFIIILCLCLAFFANLTIIITIPFIILPFTFAFYCANSSINANIGKPISIFFNFYFEYFRPRFCGSTKAIKGLLKALLVEIVLAMIISIIGIALLKNNDPEFAAIYQKILLSVTPEEMNGYMQQLIELDSFNNLSYFISIISFAFAILMLAHHTFTSYLKVSLILNTKKTISIGEVNALHMHSFSQYRKNFYKDYFKIASLLILLFIGGFTLGGLLSKFVFKFNPSQASIVGLFGGVIFALCFLPLIFDLIEMIYLHNRQVYVKSIIDIATNAFTKIKDVQDISKDLENKNEENK